MHRLIFRVRLHFADLRHTATETTMTVRLTASGAARNIEVNLAPLSAASSAPTIVEAENIRVYGSLAVEFLGHSGIPLINAIEIIRMP